MSYKASTTVNEPREVKKRLRVKSVLLAIVIVICLPLLRTPGEYVKERRDWTLASCCMKRKLLRTPMPYFLRGSTAYIM